METTTQEGTMEATKMSDKELAAALYSEYANYTDGSGDTLIELENEVCDRLNISGDETEQGLSPLANKLIYDFCKSHGYA